MKDFLKSTNCLDCTKSSNCFKKLIPSELKFINQKKKQVFYKKGENICKQGAFASYLLYISDGLVKLYLENLNNKNINIKVLKTSEFIGLSSIYGENTYHFSTIALKDSTICLIEKEGFRQILKNNGTFASDVIQSYCEDEKMLFNKIKSLGNKQMHGRLADALLYLYSSDLHDTNIYSILSRKDIAEFAGLSVESTVRLLTELKNEGIIDISGKNIKILKPELLNEISKRG